MAAAQQENEFSDGDGEAEEDFASFRFGGLSQINESSAEENKNHEERPHQVPENRNPTFPSPSQMLQSRMGQSNRNVNADEDDEFADFHYEFEHENPNNGANRPHRIGAIANSSNVRPSFGRAQMGPDSNQMIVGGGREREELRIRNREQARQAMNPGLGGGSSANPQNPFGQPLIVPPSSGNNRNQPHAANPETSIYRNIFDRAGDSQPNSGGSRIHVSFRERAQREAQRPPPRDRANPEHVRQLMDMGFTKSQCKAALK